MFKFKSALLAQVFTVFLSSQVWGGGSDLLGSFNTHYDQCNYQVVCQLSDDVFASWGSEEEIRSLIEINPQDPKALGMVRSLVRASIGAVVTQDIEKMLVCIYQLERIYQLSNLRLPQNKFQSIELYRALGIHQEILEFTEKKIQRPIQLSSAQKEYIKKYLESVIKSVDSITPSVENSLHFIEEYKGKSLEDPTTRRDIRSLDLDFLSGALYFSLFIQRCESKNSGAYDLFGPVMAFVNLQKDVSLKEKTIERMAKVLLDQKIHEVASGEISEADYKLLQGVVLNKNKKYVLNLKLTEQEIKVAADQAERLQQELLEAEVAEKDKNNQKKGKGKKSNVAQEPSPQYLKTDPKETVLNEESLKGPPSLVTFHQKEESRVQLTPKLSEQDLILGELLTKQAELDQALEQIKNLKKTVARITADNFLLTERNIELETEIQEREENRLKGREKGKENYDRLRSTTLELEKTKRVIDSLLRDQQNISETNSELKGSEFQRIQQEIQNSRLYLESMQAELTRLKILEANFNNFIAHQNLQLREASAQGSTTVGINYVECTQSEARTQEFQIDDSSSANVDGVVIGGLWIPTKTNNIGEKVVWHLGQWWRLQN